MKKTGCFFKSISLARQNGAPAGIGARFYQQKYVYYACEG
jgi:hypothetical protein